MLGCYRTGEANDPETYITAIAATLARYDEDVIKHITHPVEGLPSQSDFLPTVAEVRKACDDYIRPRLEHEARQRRIAKQLQDRADWEARNK